MKLYADKSNRIVNISEEQLCDGKEQPFIFYKLHEREIDKAAISVYNDHSKSSTHFEFLDNVRTDSLGLISIPRLLEDSQFSPENTPIYKIRIKLIKTISNWKFYNANNMDLKQIRTSEQKIGGKDI